MADGTVVVNQRFGTKDFVNVLVFSNFPTDDNMREVFANNFRDIWEESNLPASLSNAWSLQSLTFVYNDAPPIFSINVPFSEGPLIGGSLAEALALQNALLVSTSVVGPKPNRGRVYLGGFTEGANTGGGLVLPVTRAQAQAMVGLWFNPGVDHLGGPSFLRIARRASDGTLTVTAPAESQVARQNWATIRNRRLGSS